MNKVEQGFYSMPPESLISALYGVDLVVQKDKNFDQARNKVYALTNRSGELFIAKSFGVQEGSIGRIQDEVNLYDYLISSGIRAPSVVRDKEGRAIVEIDFEGKKIRLILMKYEDLERLRAESIAESDLEKIGMTIGEMHKVLKGYPANPDLAINGKLSKTKILSDEEAPVANSSVFRKEEASDLLPSHVRNLSSSLIHGDLSFEHVCLTKDGEVFFLDFGDRLFGPVMYDIAIFLTHIYRDEDLSFQRWRDIKAQLTSSYRSSLPLSEADSNFLEEIMQRRLASAINYLSSMTYSIQNRRAISRYIELLRNLRNN